MDTLWWVYVFMLFIIMPKPLILQPQPATQLLLRHRRTALLGSLSTAIILGVTIIKGGGVIELIPIGMRVLTPLNYFQPRPSITHSYCPGLYTRSLDVLMLVLQPQQALLLPCLS
jgi:hypothetical protein